MECGENVWVRPETVGDIPIPRSDSPMAYDDKKGTMVLYGGWRHSWHGDMAVCNVAAVVGPPYSVEDISPTIGPVTGSTLVELRGMGFSTVKGEVTVRYACPKGFEVGSCGTVIDDQTITFETPNYEHYGAVEIECRVSIGPKPLTNSKVKMSYFSVTDASQCLAFGPGLVNGCIAGNPTTICIVAKDEHGNNRSCGMDEFSIRIEPPAQPDELKDLDIEVKETKPDKDHDFDPQFAIEPECTDADELKVQVELSDSGDGTYVAAFAAPVVGTYTITIEFMGTFDGKAGPVRGSPFQMTCVDRDEYIEKNPKDIRLSEGETEPSDELLSFNNSMDGPIVTNDVLNKIKEIREFSNKKKRGLQAAVVLLGPGLVLHGRAHGLGVDPAPLARDDLLDAHRRLLDAVARHGAALVGRALPVLGQPEVAGARRLVLGAAVHGHAPLRRDGRRRDHDLTSTQAAAREWCLAYRT